MTEEVTRNLASYAAHSTAPVSQAVVQQSSCIQGAVQRQDKQPMGLPEAVHKHGRQCYVLLFICARLTVPCMLRFVLGQLL